MTDRRNRRRSGALSPLTERRLEPLAANPPKRNPNNVLVDYSQVQDCFMGVRFIFECGIKLKAEPMTIATASILFHRFCSKVDETQYDIYLIGATSLYLAGKIESQLIRLRDIINVSRATIHRNTPPLELGEKYWSFRDSIIQTELHMVRILGFQMNIQHPHRFLVHYLKSLEEWIGTEEFSKSPIARTAWAFCQDFHHDSSILNYVPQAIAVAAIELSMVAHGCTVPLCASEGRNSWQSIFYSKFNRVEQEEIMGKMLNLYEHELGVLSNVLFQESKDKDSNPKLSH